MSFSLVAEWGLVVVHGLLIAMASFAVEHGLYACWLQLLWYVGSVVAAPGLKSRTAQEFSPKCQQSQG